MKYTKNTIGIQNITYFRRRGVALGIGLVVALVVGVVIAATQTPREAQAATDLNADTRQIPMTQIATHPEAVVGLTGYGDSTWSASIHQIVFDGDDLYAGYGDWGFNSDSHGGPKPTNHSARVGLRAFNVDTRQWSSDIFYTGTEANTTFRVLGGNIFAPTTDASIYTGETDPVTGEAIRRGGSNGGGFTTNRGGQWQNIFPDEVRSAYHVFDIESFDGGDQDLWLFGSIGNVSGFSQYGAMIWHSSDGGATWEAAKQEDEPQANSERYYWGAILGDKLYTQATHGLSDSPMHVYNRTTDSWSTLPRQPACGYGISQPKYFDGMAICSSFATSLTMFDGTESRVYDFPADPIDGRPFGHTRALAVDGEYLYRLTNNHYLMRTNSLDGEWEGLGTVDISNLYYFITAMEIHDGRVYLGDHKANIWESDLLVAQPILPPNIVPDSVGPARFSSGSTRAQIPYSVLSGHQVGNLIATSDTGQGIAPGFELNCSAPGADDGLFRLNSGILTTGEQLVNDSSQQRQYEICVKTSYANYPGLPAVEQKLVITQVAPRQISVHQNGPGAVNVPNRPTFTGRAEPLATVRVDVHSDVVTCETTADAQGNWSCTLPSDLPDGEHRVVVTVWPPGMGASQTFQYVIYINISGNNNKEENNNMQTQTLTQTITVLVGDVTNGASASIGGGSLADTGMSLALILSISLGLITLALAIIFLFRSKHLRLPRSSKGFGIFTFLAIGAVSLAAGLPSVNATPTLTIDANQSNINITIPKGGGTATTTTKITTATANATGYTLNSSLEAEEPGIAISLKGGDVTTTTPLTKNTPPLTIKTTNSATTDDQTEVELTFTIDGTVTEGKKELKLSYKVADNAPAPVAIDQAVCRNADPASGCQMDIDSAMIPITYIGEPTDDIATTKWAKADTATPGNWYDYQNKQWANAVTVKANKLASYQSAPAGTPVNEDDVMAYYTYVPRYEYQVCRPNASDAIDGLAISGCPSDLKAPYNFNIKFQTPAQTTSLVGLPGAEVPGGWATHPAFTFGSTELAGIWVGKYETSSPDTITSPDMAESAVAAGHVAIKPNQNGINYQNIATQFATAQSLADPGSPSYQNLNSSQTDSRMMRDADWGAVSYLATSIYGKTASEQVWINNCYYSNSGNRNYGARTGWSADTPSDDVDWGTQDCVLGTNDTGAYHTAQGQQASTTGNTYGIYDMSGGNVEYTLSNLNHQESSYGNYAFGGSANFPDLKYLDIYPNPPFTGDDWYTNNSFCTWQACGGRALHETKEISAVSSYDQSWWADYSSFVNPGYPWGWRGGASNDGPYAGLFSARSNDGGAGRSTGFRVVQSRF